MGVWEYGSMGVWEYGVLKTFLARGAQMYGAFCGDDYFLLGGGARKKRLFSLKKMEYGVLEYGAVGGAAYWSMAGRRPAGASEYWSIGPAIYSLQGANQTSKFIKYTIVSQGRYCTF